MEVCEDWKQRPVEIGGLGGKDLNFIGDNHSGSRDQNDICNNMNRNETAIFTDGIYWLHDDNDEATPGIDFRRE
jgi:hypothetical protein